MAPLAARAIPRAHIQARIRRARIRAGRILRRPTRPQDRPARSKRHDAADTELTRGRLELLHLRSDELHREARAERLRAIEIRERSKQRQWSANAAVEPACVHEAQRARPR